MPKSITVPETGATAPNIRLAMESGSARRLARVADVGLGGRKAVCQIPFIRDQHGLASKVLRGHDDETSKNPLSKRPIYCKTERRGGDPQHRRSVLIASPKIKVAAHALGCFYSNRSLKHWRICGNSNN